MRFPNVAALLVFLLLGAGIALAQETTGTIRGRVVDAQDLSIPGASITATGPQGTKLSTTDTDGRFTLAFLTPGVYTLRAELQGFKTVEQKNVTVPLGGVTEIAVKMAVGAIADIVDVTGAAPQIDQSSTTTGAVLSSEMFDQLPTGRRLSDTLSMAPGVGSSGTAGSTNPSMAGGSGLDNKYEIDGVNVTSTGYGGFGSYSIEYGSLGNATPFDFIKEVQVKTGGYEAEYGEALGGVVNVVTKSGANLLAGSLFGYFRPTKLEGTWTQFQSANFTTTQTLGSRSYDGGAEAGGPIVKDHLFFYGAIDPTWSYVTLQAPATRPLLSLGGVDQERRNTNYAAKGTWQISSGQRLDASFFGDPSTGPNGPQRPSAMTAQDTSQFSSLNYGGNNEGIRYSGVFTSRWLVEATYARANNTISELPSVNTWQVTDRTTPTPVNSGGVGFFEGGNNSLDNQFAVSATNAIGGHQIKYGGEFDHVNYLQNTEYSGPQVLTPGGLTTSGVAVRILPDPTYGKIYEVIRGKLSGPDATTQNYFDLFLQDSWKIGDRLTINPGVRYEQEQQTGNVETLTLKNNWSPRIGATLDLVGGGKSKLYGSAGRFYARMPNDLAARALSVDNSVSFADFFDAGLTKIVPTGVLAAGRTSHFNPGASSADAIDPNIKMSYTNEYNIGFEQQAMANTTIGVRYLHRSLGRAIEDVQNAPYVPYFNGDPGVTYNYYLTNPTSSTPVFPQVPGYNISFATPVHVYNAVEFTLARRIANNWSALASYRWSRLRGNYEGYYDNLNGQSDPGITASFDFPYNDPSYTALGGALGLPGDLRYLADPNGILSLDQPHSFKAFGSYNARGLNVGVGFTAHSGLPLTPVDYNPAYGENGDIPNAPLGSGIQTINGFMTRTPFETQTDVQLSYAIKFAGRRDLTLLADVFNVFNQQTVLLYDYYRQLGFNIPNPDFGQPVSQQVNAPGPQFQAPRQVRLGIRLHF